MSIANEKRNPSPTTERRLEFSPRHGCRRARKSKQWSWPLVLGSLPCLSIIYNNNSNNNDSYYPHTQVQLMASYIVLAYSLSFFSPGLISFHPLLSIVYSLRHSPILQTINYTHHCDTSPSFSTWARKSFNSLTTFLISQTNHLVSRNLDPTIFPIKHLEIRSMSGRY